MFSPIPEIYGELKCFYYLYGLKYRITFHLILEESAVLWNAKWDSITWSYSIELRLRSQLYHNLSRSFCFYLLYNLSITLRTSAKRSYIPDTLKSYPAVRYRRGVVWERICRPSTAPGRSSPGITTTVDCRVPRGCGCELSAAFLVVN